MDPPVVALCWRWLGNLSVLSPVAVQEPEDYDDEVFEEEETELTYELKFATLLCLKHVLWIVPVKAFQ